MNVTTEQLEKRQVALQVEVEPERLERSMERAYRRIVNRTNIPGFRRGKAPRIMVERYLGKATLLQEALDILVPEAYAQAVEENAIPALGQPSIEITEVEPSVSFKATVAVQPTIELGAYQQLSFNLDVPETTEEQINEVLEELRSSYAPWEPVERQVQFGDLVTFQIESELIEQDNKSPFIQQQDASYLVTEGRPEPVPGFAEQLEGQEKGTTREFTLPLPEDTAKSAEFKVTIAEIKEKRIPELDDEFAKSIGDEYESLQALRDKIVQDLQARAEREARTAIESQIVDAVVGLAQVDYPDILTDHEIEHLIELDRNLTRDPQGRIDDYLGSIGKSLEEFREQYREEATQRVVRSLVLRQVAEEEKIEVTSEELDTETEELIKGAGEQQAWLKDWFATPERRSSLERTLMSRKTLQRLFDLTTGEAPTPSDDPPEETPPTEGDPEPEKAAASPSGKEGETRRPRSRSRSRSS